MDFPSFYKVLDSILSKSELSFPVSEDNYSQFLVNRYLSFVCPAACALVNRCFNTMESFPSEDIQSSFEHTRAVFPNVGRQFIKYKRKPAVEKMRELGIDEEEIDSIASMLEVSRREVRDYILTLNK